MNFFTSTQLPRYTPSECVLKADDLDFRENFKVTSRGMVTSLKRYFYSPEEVVVRHKFLMENKDDRRGYSLFYLIETAEGRRGYLIEEENDFSDGRAASFVSEIPGNNAARPAALLTTGSWLRSLSNFF